MAERPVSTSRAMAAWAGLAALAAGLCLREVLADLEQARSAGSAATAAVEWAILVYGTLPRAVVALIAGATLGLSGLLLQRILRNPLAEPSTLGIAAGAQLTLAVAALQGQALAGLSRQAVAFAGGVAAVTCVLALTWRRGLEPVAVVLAGMMVSLTCTAAAAALILANGEYMFSLFIWGGGALAQENWGPAASLAVQLGIGFSVALLLVKPLAVLGLDEAGARSLGVALHTTRLAIVALAVWMASSVTAAVGIIGFVGLAAPALATLSGLHSVRTRLVGAPLIGAVLLWLADGLVQLAAAGGGERVPTGAATALLGGPLLLWMLPRLKMFEWPNLAASRATVVRRLANPWAAVAILAAAVPTVALAALVLGRGPDGWAIAFTELLTMARAARGRGRRRRRHAGRCRRDRAAAHCQSARQSRSARHRQRRRRRAHPRPVGRADLRPACPVRRLGRRCLGRPRHRTRRVGPPRPWPGTNAARWHGRRSAV